MPVFGEQVEDEAHDEGKGRAKDDAKAHHAPLSVPDCTTHSGPSSCTQQIHCLAWLVGDLACKVKQTFARHACCCSSKKGEEQLN